MSISSCADKIRFSLSDRSGKLCFEQFDIIDHPACNNVAEQMRAVIVGKPLAEIDLDALQAIECRGSRGCIEAACEIIAECQRMFVPKSRASRSR